MEQNEWVVINYTLPREPSRTRVSIWRKLKKIGAVNIQQSMWILPLTEHHVALLNDIKSEVLQNSGEAFVMKSVADEDGRRNIIERFNAARDEEYQELFEECGKFLKEIDREIARKNFSFAEIEENEEELLKLKQWYQKIKARDTFQAPLCERSDALLAQCEEALELFCDKVYEFTNSEN